MFSALRAGDAGAASTADPALPGTSRARGRRFGRPAVVSSLARSVTAPLAARQPSSDSVANPRSARPATAPTGSGSGAGAGRAGPAGAGRGGAEAGVTGRSVVGRSPHGRAVIGRATAGRSN